MSAPARQGQRLTKNEDSIVKMFTNNGHNFNAIRFNYCGEMSTFVIIITSLSIDSTSLYVIS